MTSGVSIREYLISLTWKSLKPDHLVGVEGGFHNTPVGVVLLLAFGIFVIPRAVLTTGTPEPFEVC